MDEPEPSSVEESGEPEKEPEKELSEREAHEELESRYRDLEETLKWLQADYENYKKEVVKEIGREVERGNERLVYDLLPILDSMDELLNLETDEVVLSGIRAIRKSMFKVLQEHGLEQLSRVGEPFDPLIEEAIGVIEGSRDGIVVEEVRKGYRFKEKVLRHPLVRIGRSVKGD
jgi:molecular chaperone GrpE